jgi:D-3-phosphoglycerate dehydrogenase
MHKALSNSLKRVVRLDNWCHPIFAERLARESDIVLQTHRRQAVEDTLSALSHAHVYHLTSTRDEVPEDLHVRRQLIDLCPNLVCVSASGAGYDTVDVAACTEAGILVVNQAGGNARAVAEHTLGLMLGLMHRIVEADRRLRVERGFSREELMGRDLEGKSLGLIGFGHVGQRVARLADAFGMRVIAYDPYADPHGFGGSIRRMSRLEDLLSASDIVSLHCPLNDETRGMIGAREFSRMKAGALFISTARGGIHDECALEEALRGGHIAGAGLDVWSREPPPLDHPLLARSNVIATYHTAGVTHEARRNMAEIAADQIIEVLSRRTPPRLVNYEVLSSARWSAQD